MRGKVMKIKSTTAVNCKSYEKCTNSSISFSEKNVKHVGYKS